MTISEYIKKYGTSGTTIVAAEVCRKIEGYENDPAVAVLGEMMVYLQSALEDHIASTGG